MKIVDATKNHVVDRGYEDSHEIRSLSSWRHWIGHDAISVVDRQSYGAASGHQKRKGISGGTMVYQVQNRWEP